jgi:hypothetical protein
MVRRTVNVRARWLKLDMCEMARDFVEHVVPTVFEITYILRQGHNQI